MTKYLLPTTLSSLLPKGLLALIIALALPLNAGAETQSSELERSRAQWEKLSSEEREALRKRLETFKTLPQSERTQLLKRYKRFKTLSPAKKKELRDK